MAHVFVVGVAVFDLIFSVAEFPREAEKFRAIDAHTVGGGCAANAAVAIARLDGEATLAARLGSDPIGDLILSDLASEGVNTGMINRAVDGRSSFSSVYVDRRGERQIMNFRGQRLSENTGWLANAPSCDAVLADTRWHEGAIAALELAEQRKISGIVDAEAPTEIELLKKASHVAFSRTGLLSLSDQTDLAGALLEIAGKLPGWICVTDGENGVYHIADGLIRHIPAFKVDIKDTLGAGDVWHGAFALRIGEGADEATSIEFANAAAALKCTSLGGRSGCPDRQKVNQFLRENK